MAMQRKYQKWPIRCDRMKLSIFSIKIHTDKVIVRKKSRNFDQ